MKKRVLGNLEVSAIGVGCMGMSHAAGTPMDMDEAVRVLRAAVDMGYTFSIQPKIMDLRMIRIIMRRFWERLFRASGTRW